MDILEELKQDANQERMLALWKKYRIPFFLVIAGIIVISGIHAWHTHVRHQNIDFASTLYGRGLILEEKGEISQSIETLSQLSDLKLRGFRTLSLLFLGDILSETNKSQAKEKYSLIYEDKANSSAFRYLALVKSILLDFSSKKHKADFLAPLHDLQHTTTAPTAWTRISQEMEALHSYNLNKLSQAHSLYASIVQNPNAPTSQKRRALRMLMIIESQPQFSAPTSS